MTITVHNGDEALTGRVVVSAVWEDGTTASCKTGTSSGSCSITRRFPNSTPVRSFTVTNLTLSGYVYGSSSNHDPDGESDGTTIVVSRPS